MLQILVNTRLRLRPVAPMGLPHLGGRHRSSASPTSRTRAGSATASTSRAARCCRSASSGPSRSTRSGARSGGVQAGESVIQEFGDAQEYLIRVPVGGGTLDEVSKRIDGGLRQAGLPGFEVRRLEFVGPQVGRGPAVGRGPGRALGHGGHPRLHGVPVRLQGRRGGHPGPHARRDHLGRGDVPDAPRDVAARAGGPPDHRRLLDQRHDRDVRPDPGEPGARAPEGRDPWPT